LVLPEVLKNPREYFINRRNANYMPKLIGKLLEDVAIKPKFEPRKPWRHWSKAKKSVKLSYNNKFKKKN
jgi:hypothetical protein